MENEFKILCAFCSAPFTAKMLVDLEEGSGCETCGSGSANLVIEIKCSNCGKIAYKKEGRGYDW